MSSRPRKPIASRCCAASAWTSRACRPLRKRLRASSPTPRPLPTKRPSTGCSPLPITAIGCARCHDHKYDPISQREFYQLFAYYNNTDEITTEAERNDLHRPVLNVATKEQLARVAAYKSQLAILNREFAAYVKELSKKPTE